MASEVEVLRRLAARERSEIARSASVLRNNYNVLVEVARLLGTSVNTPYWPKTVLQLDDLRIFWDGYGGSIFLTVDDCTVIAHYDGRVYGSDDRREYECILRVAERVKQLLDRIDRVREELETLREITDIICATPTCWETKQRLLERQRQRVLELLRG